MSRHVLELHLANVMMLRRTLQSDTRPLGEDLDEFELRQMCREVLRDLGIRPPLEAEVLCERLGAARGRPITLIPCALPVSGAFGCLVPMPRTDLIIYQRQTTRRHQWYIIFHEVLHLLRGHMSTGGDGQSLLCSELFANTNVACRRQTLYDRWQEWEAETGATILSEWVTVPAGAASLHADTTAERAIIRAFGDTSGWP
jgi:hypothetical protein